MKNLIISPVGDSSVHKEWIKNDCGADLFLIYYGSSDKVYADYKIDSKYILKMSGEKGALLHYIYVNFDKIYSKYDNIWLPDDDVILSSCQIKQMFKIHKNYDLLLSQPSIEGYLSHDILKPNFDSILRFTNFVEIMCPVMSKSAFSTLAPFYSENISSHGLDFLWPKLLGYPTNKIAILDEIVAIHSKPVSVKGNRFGVNPMDELLALKNKYELDFSQQVYGSIKSIKNV